MTIDDENLTADRDLEFKSETLGNTLFFPVAHIVELRQWAHPEDLVELIPTPLADDLLKIINFAINYLVDIRTALERR